ncbi:MAG: hypothetical protein ACI9B8_003071, partial [Sulfitobacter sp.]
KMTLANGPISLSGATLAIAASNFVVRPDQVPLSRTDAILTAAAASTHQIEPPD